MKSADRALRLIESLSRRQPRRFVELSEELQIPRGSLHALLAALSSGGWVSVDRDRGVALGYRALALTPAAPSLTDLVQLTDRPLTRLRDELGETAHLATLDGREIVYLSSRYSDHALGVRFVPGRRLPAQLTALGKAMLAQLESHELETALPLEYATPTPTSIPDERALRRALQLTRAKGFAEDDGEGTLGVHCVAVALVHHDLPTSAISCSIPSARFDPDRVPMIVAQLGATRDAILGQLRPLD